MAGGLEYSVKMNDIKVLIQSTDIGLDIKFNEYNLDLNEITQALHDDRYEVAQSKDISTYTFQNINQYNVYSLLNHKTDYVDRDGYYEIKLFCPKDKKIVNPVGLLDELHLAYIGLNNSNNAKTVLSSIIQNYSLQNILPVVTTDQKKYYCKVSSKQDLISIFNNEKIYAVNKLYIFNSSFQRNHEDSNLLDYFKEIVHLRQLSITNNNLLLTEIKVGNLVLGNKSIYFPSFLIFFRQGESLHYKTLDNSSYRTIPTNNFSFSVNFYQGSISQNNGESEKEKTFFERYGLLVLMCSFIFVGVGLYFGFFYEPKQTITVSGNGEGGADTNLAHEKSIMDTNKVVLKKNEYFEEDIDPKSNKKILFYLNNGKRSDTIIYNSSQNICLINTNYSDDKDLKNSIKIFENNVFKKMHKNDKDVENKLINELKAKCGCSVEKPNTNIPNTKIPNKNNIIENKNVNKTADKPKETIVKDKTKD